MVTKTTGAFDTISSDEEFLKSVCAIQERLNTPEGCEALRAMSWEERCTAFGLTEAPHTVQFLTPIPAGKSAQASGRV